MSADVALNRSPLIAGEGATTFVEGTGIFEAACGLADSLQKGDFLSIGGNFAGLALSSLGAIMDPLQAVFAAGVGWLIEHVKVLREPLDMLAGDPKAIAAQAETWWNIQRRLIEATQMYVDDVARSTAEWTSEAVTAYREKVRFFAEHIRALGILADLNGKVATVAGSIIGVIRNTIRDIVAEVVGACISKAIQAATVVLIPKVATEISIMVADCSRRILQVLDRLFDAAKRVGACRGRAESLLNAVRKANDNVMDLRAIRSEAAQSAGTGWSGLRQAHSKIGQGHALVHGPIEKVVEDAAVNASLTNTAQNSGQTGDTLRKEPEDRPTLELPL